MTFSRTRFALALILSSGAFLTSCITIHRHFTFPDPAGAYAVGTRALDLVDNSREEPYTRDPSDRREFMVQLWYPVDPTVTIGLTPEPYGTEIEDTLSAIGGRRAEGFRYLHSIPTRSYAGVPLSPARRKYPVILFSPGNLSTRFQSLNQVNLLVSRGYVVVGIDHPYTSAVVRFPNGRAIRVSDIETRPKPSEGMNQTNTELEVRVRDVRFTLDTLEKLQKEENSPFRGRLDLDHVGVFGHSLGGGTVLQATAEDPRIKAVLSEEGGVWGSVIDSGLRVPLMYLQASKTLEAPTFSSAGIKSDMDSKENFATFKRQFAGELTAVFRKSGADRYYLNVKGFNHVSFSDVPLFSDLFSKDVKYDRTLVLVNEYLLAFFDCYLEGRPSSLLDGPSPRFPEVIFKKNTTEPFK